MIISAKMFYHNAFFFSDHFLNDFLVTFPIFMSTEILCSELLSKYPFH